jgi:hypothetical protein
MARRGSARSKRSGSLVGKLYSPFGHFFKATGNSVRAVSKGVGNVAGKVVNTAGTVGSRFARGADNTISNLTRGRKNRRGSTRRSTRRHGRR